MLEINRQFIIYGLGVVLFANYLRTLSPTIAGGDAGELVAEGCQLGTAHPPGYPLFTLIVHVLKEYISSSILDSSPAYRVNIFSAFCTTIAAVCIGLVVNMSRITTNIDKNSNFHIHQTGGIIISMCMFALSPLIWQYAVTAEVFPLNTMFSGLIVYLVCLFSKTKSINVSYLGAFICGLALCNQHTIILYVAPLVLWMFVLLRNRLLHEPMVFIKLSMCFFSGVMPYVYLPWSSIYNSRDGSWGDMTTIEGFLHHFLRKDYGTFQLFSGATGRNSEGFMMRNQAYLHDLYETQGFHFIPYLSLIGILSWWSYGSIVSTASVGITDNKHDEITSSNNISNNNSSNNSSSSNCNSNIKPNPTSIKNRKNKNKNKNKENLILDNESIDNNDAEKKDIINNKDIDDLSRISSIEANFTPIILLFTQLFYFGIFHTLANLPLGDKLLFGVHQRFWMQPAIITYIWSGVGFNTIFNFLNMLINRNNTNNIVSFIIYISSLIVVITLVTCQYNKWIDITDQSQAMHFHNYARALLDPLPKNAVLLINYDMQWTSVRYIQRCEGYRPDITSINLSMMTYSWFKLKHKLYSDLKFPGTHYSSYGASQSTDKIKIDTFTLKDFLDVNVNSRDIFLSGKLSFPDPNLDREYSYVPIGLVSQFVPMSVSQNGTKYRYDVFNSWNSVSKVLSTLPDVDKYTEETWEWTIGRDFKDRVIDTGAYFLESAIAVSSVDPIPLIEAAYWLETAILLEKNNPSTILLKNAGLAHVHLVQNKLIDSLNLNGGYPLPMSDIFQTIQLLNWPKQDSKTWSADRFAVLWGLFLTREDAISDHQYPTIKKMYEAATKKEAPAIKKKTKNKTKKN